MEIDANEKNEKDFIKKKRYRQQVALVKTL